ncbi:TadE/TadG family type IV pilus assembly protein [Terrihabitans sp. B22-R8]|uniref:TadE/TadG family type IV pilus assembly protein n=1 Tax=Terrihabitans sp. B22-R8 TaxID=3425128 RepID=UPI00403C9377
MSLLKRLRGDEKGVAMVLFALSLLPIMMAAGAAVDYTRAAQVKSELQSRLDTAVLSGASKDSGKEAAAQALLSAADLPAGATIVSTKFTAKGEDLSGTVTADVSTSMMKIINVQTLPVTVTSTARLMVTTHEGNNTPDEEVVTPGSPVCILVKNANADRALTINSGVTINAPSCEMHIRSTSGSPATMDNVQDVNMKRLCFKSPKFNTNSTNSAVEKNCPAIEDPFVDKMPTVTVPTNNCSTRNGGSYDANSNGKDLVLAPGDYCGLNFNSGFNSVTLKAGKYRGLNLGGAKTFNLNPGFYENININSGITTVNFAPGLYIWKGSTNFNSGIKFVGKGVTFYYPDANSYIQFNDRVESDLRAPESGTYAGILFFEAKNLSSSGFTINGNANQYFEGLIYWPSRNVTFNSASTVNSNKISIVVDKLLLNGGLNWKIEPGSGALRNPDTVTVTPGKPGESLTARNVRLVN